MTDVALLYYASHSLRGASNHDYRIGLDPFVYEVLRQQYGTTFEAAWLAATVPATSDKAIVIVERRCHPNFKFILENAAYFCPGAAIHIFCSDANRPFVEYICQPHETVHIHEWFRGIGTAEEGKRAYNELLCQERFWEAIPSENILLLEMDCYLRHPVPFEEWGAAYDYIACRWSWEPDRPGGAGLSFRKRSMMLNICRRVAVAADDMQDTYVCRGVEELGYRYPPIEKKYFAESYYVDDPIGVHQWWTFLEGISESIRETILSNYLVCEAPTSSPQLLQQSSSSPSSS